MENTQNEQVLSMEELAKAVTGQPREPEEQYQQIEPEQSEPEQPEPEGQQEEYIEVDGGQVPLSEIDNPKSYKFFQSKFTKEQQEKQKIMEEKIRLEERVRMLEQKPQEVNQAPKEVTQVPKKPDPLPPMPEGFDLIEATTDPLSPSGQWYQKKLRYDIEKDAYDNYLYGQLEQERQTRLQQEKLAQQKAALIGQFQNAGLTPEEASKAFDYYSQVFNSNDPAELVRLFKLANQKPVKPAGNFKAQGQRQDTIPLPPGQAPTTTEPDEPSYGEALLNMAKQFGYMK